MMPLRRCFVLREVEIPMRDLAPGDVYRLGKATPDDVNCDESEYAAVTEKAKPCPPEGNTIVSCVVLGFTAVEKGSTLPTLNFKGTQ